MFLKSELTIEKIKLHLATSAYSGHSEPSFSDDHLNYLNVNNGRRHWQTNIKRAAEKNAENDREPR